MNPANLTPEPEIIVWPETHYVYIERSGPFQESAPAAWQTMHGLIPELLKTGQVLHYLSLYLLPPKQVYRAGVALAEEPKQLPAGLAYTKFAGGKYSKFTLTGSFAQLPEACGRVFEIVTEKKIQVRDNFFIEHYITDPRTTPEEKLQTGILVPTV